MFKRVVVCTDLTPGSDGLVAWVGSLKALGLREVILTHVVDVFSGETGSEAGISDLFASQTVSLEAEGLVVRVDTPVGHPSHAIEEIAEREGASLIVMGTRSRGLYDSAFSGSVSSDLLQLTSRPVLLAPYGPEGGGLAAPSCARLLGHVLLPTDLSEAGERGLNALAALAPQGIDRVTVLHVLQPDREDRGQLHAVPDFDSGIGEVRQRLRQLGAASVVERLAYGNPATCVLEAANSGEFTMVVLAAQRAVSRSVGTTVRAALVAESSTPMLIVPAKVRWTTSDAIFATSG